MSVTHSYISPDRLTNVYWLPYISNRRVKVLKPGEVHPSGPPDLLNKLLQSEISYISAFKNREAGPRAKEKHRNGNCYRSHYLYSVA
jgi:hypothetical protein